MYGELPIASGEAQILDYDLSKLKRKQVPYLRRKLGVVFQDFQLLTDRNVEENLLFVLRATGWRDKNAMKSHVMDVLDQVGMANKAYKMPYQLSGGEQQRVVIARALLNMPSLILADEPTGNLDHETGKEIMDLLYSISKAGITIIMSTHNIIWPEQYPGRKLYFINETMDEARLNAGMEAKKVIIKTIQRVASEATVENAVSIFHIDNDEVKGRIIGREGRNIRALEAATGVEIVVDDTPECITLSAFDPIRREIARLSLHQLVQDGRIHPARIEEVVAKVTQQIEEEIVEIGKRTTIDLGVHGLHPELVRLVGKMKYRSSYGQNLLQHSRETANLCATMASELGLNPKTARRAGLLHDIGKVADEDYELPHAEVGMKLCEKYGEKPEICNAVGSHHDEMEMDTLIAPIVQACDAISGARPGARREIVETYIKRLKDLENIAMAHEGVIKTYALQAGRELRVIVGADKISDKDTELLSYDIAKKIQDEMTYPGQVKITVIRETRAISYAK